MKRIVWYPFLCDDDDEPGPLLYDGPLLYADFTLDENEIVVGLTAALDDERFRVPLRRVLGKEFTRHLRRGRRMARAGHK